MASFYGLLIYALLQTLLIPTINVSSIMIEATLIDRLKQGNKGAFCELVRENGKTVFNICYRFLMNKEDAEDMAQEVFIEVFHSIKQFRGEAKLSTWLYRIAVTKSLDEIKRQKRKKRFSSGAGLLGLECIAHCVAGNERPDYKLEQKEHHRLLRNALSKLPENQRVAFTLSKVQGFSNSEIADMIGNSLTAVYSLIYRARKTLKMIFDSQLTVASASTLMATNYSSGLFKNSSKAA
ncbi:MAG: RNA polymerase sigma factor [Bacteroidetes bacterium]|nr:RNA polymerase sigma factor [Bacteroidota bacterium]